MVARGACCWIAPLVAFAASAQEPAADTLAYEILRRAKSVRTVTAAPTLDAELVALRELFAQGDAAVPALRKLAREATPAGRVLALCGLEVLGDSECAALRAKLMTSQGRVLVVYDTKLAWNDSPLSEVVASTRPDAVRKSRGSPPERWGFSSGTPDLLGGGLPWGTVLQPPLSDTSRLAGQPIASWIERLGTPNRLIRREAEAVLVSLGEASVAPLASALAEPAHARWAARTLGRLGFLALPALPALRQGLSSKLPMTRLACANTLRGFGPYASRAFRELARRANDPAELLQVRLACVMACYGSAPRHVRAGLEELLSPDTLRELVLTGVTHPDPSIVDLAEPLLRYRLTRVSAQQPDLLRRLAETGVEAAYKSWDDLETGLVPFPALARAACSPAADLRRVARRALAKDPDATAQALRPLLSAADPRKRGEAAVGLLGVPSARREACGVLAECLRQAAVAKELLHGLLEPSDVEFPEALCEAILTFACGAGEVAQLASEVYLALPAASRAASEQSLLERLRNDPSDRPSVLLALRTGVEPLVREATRALVGLLESEDPRVRRGAAASLIEGEASGDALAAAWDTIARATASDPRARETLLNWARVDDLASPAKDVETAWLEGREPHLVAWVAGGWIRRAEQAGRVVWDAAESGLLRVVVDPTSLPAQIAARRAFAKDPEQVSTVLESELGEDVGAVIYRGLVAALLGDHDGAWAAPVFADLLRDLDLGDPAAGAPWGDVFAQGLARSTTPVRWRLVRALESLGPAACAAAPALRRAGSAAANDPELRLAIDEALRAVLGA